MQRQMLKSKIHRATVTDCVLFGDGHPDQEALL
jgi:aspartate 1-decarboxylase